MLPCEWENQYRMHFELRNRMSTLLRLSTDLIQLKFSVLHEKELCHVPQYSAKLDRVSFVVSMHTLQHGWYFQKKPDSTNFLSTLNLCPKFLLNILTFVWWHLQTIPKHYFVASAWFKYVQTIFSLHIFCIISFDGALWMKKMHNIFTSWLF